MLEDPVSFVMTELPTQAKSADHCSLEKLGTRGTLYYWQFAMATVILRQEGGSHSFEERHIRMEDTDNVTVGRSTETSKPDNGNAIFSSAAISKEHAVFWFDKHARRFYLRNQESSTGCLLNEENVGQCAAVELLNGDRVYYSVWSEWGRLSC